MPLTIRDLALKCTVRWLGGNHFKVTMPSKRIHFATVKWDNGDVIVECSNPVARLAVEMHERSRVAGRQFN